MFIVQLFICQFKYLSIQILVVDNFTYSINTPAFLTMQLNCHQLGGGFGCAMLAAANTAWSLSPREEEQASEVWWGR